MAFALLATIIVAITGETGFFVKRYPLKARYKYNHKATGPLGGGGYFSFSDHDCVRTGISHRTRPVRVWNAYTW